MRSDEFHFPATPRRAQRWRCGWARWFCLVVLVVIAMPTRAVERLKKTVQLYALTSANDFPQRDPQDWRLLGSNDGGKTWTTLDVRKDEVFPDRQQRRLFKTGNTNGYETYRLQIDRVRDPRVANSVQLAEIELMGATENDLEPIPIFTDAVTAQGDNPPSELVGKLFDGRVETKWLDNKPRDRSTCASWVQWQYAAPAETVVTNISQLVALRARASDGYRVRIEGVVVGRTGADREWSIADAAGCVEISALAGEEALQPGQPVTFSGVSQWRSGKVGLTEGAVQARGAKSATLPERIDLEQPLAAQENLKWVEIEGEVRYRRSDGGEISFDVQDEGAAMRVYWRGAADSLSLPSTGARVTVRGLCRGAFNEQGTWVAAGLWAAGAEAVTAGASQQSGRTSNGASSAKNSAPVPDTLTKIEQIRRLTQEQLQRRPHVKFRGVVTELFGAFMQDDTAGVEVAFQGSESRKVTEPGTYIEVEGWGGLGDAGNPVVSADRVTVLGKGKWPEPQRMSLSRLMSERTDAQWIELEGVVRSTDGAHLLLICYGRDVTASMSAGAAGLVKNLVDAAVRVRGVGVTALDDRGRIQGIHLLIPSLEHVDVVEPPANPETLPVRPIGSLLGLSGPRESYHRVKVEGIVTLQENQKLFLQDASGSALAILKEEVLLDARFGRSRWLFWRTQQTNAPVRADLRFSPGDKVELVGFPETRSYSPALTEVTVRKISSGNEVKPYEATVNGINDGRADSQLVVVEGMLLGQNRVGAQVVMALEWNDRTLQVLVPVKEAVAAAIVPGSRLRVTGVCQVDPAPYAELGQRVAAVRILTRSAADLVVLSQPAWWTMKRVLTVMGGMALLILGALIWIKQLRKQVEERSRQLAAEIQLREQTERRSALEHERSRIAKDLHDDLGANLAQIVFLSQRVEGGQNDAQEMNRYFGLIPTTARRTIQSLDEIVWAINPRHDSLESLANYLSQFAQEHLTLAGVRCVLDVPTVLPAVPLSAEIRHNLLLTTREALQNAVTHAAATEVRLVLQLDEAGLSITIADNGKGFEPTAVSRDGNGLPNMRRRLESIGGQLEIKSVPGQGTTVRLFVSREVLHGRVIGGNGVATSEL